MEFFILNSCMHDIHKPHILSTTHSQEKQSRIAGLYIPYLTMMLEHSLRFHKNLDRPKIDDSLLSIHRIAPTTPSHDGNMSPILMKRNSAISNTFSSESQSIMSLTGSGKVPPILPFDDDEAREFLLCFSFLLKNLHSCTYACFSSFILPFSSILFEYLPLFRF